MPTIKEVAARCGVAKSTVSNVINGKGHVSDELRAKILEAVRDMGYTPSPLARSLSLRNGAGGGGSCARPGFSGYAVETPNPDGALAGPLMRLALDAVSYLTQAGLEPVTVVESRSDYDTPLTGCRIAPALDWPGALRAVALHLLGLGVAEAALYVTGDGIADAHLVAALESFAIADSAGRDFRIAVCGEARSAADGLRLLGKADRRKAVVFASPPAALGYGIACVSQRPAAKEACICLAEVDELRADELPVTAVYHKLDASRLAVDSLPEAGRVEWLSSATLVEREKRFAQSVAARPADDFLD